MLILTRRPGESIVIGDVVKVTIVGVDGRQVRLGIQAPGDVEVHREEVYKRIKEENIKAAESGPEGLKKIVEIWRKAK